MSNVALCRICLASDTKLYFIANTLYQEIFEKLSTELCTEDGRPESVCYVCMSQLQRCRRLVDMSRRAEDVLTQLYNSGIQITPESIKELNVHLKNPLSTVILPTTNIEDQPYDVPQIAIDQAATQEQYVELEIEISYLQQKKKKRKVDCNVKKECFHNVKIKKERTEYPEDSNNGTPHKLVKNEVNKSSENSSGYFTQVTSSMDMVPNRRPYSCNLCEKRYKSYSTLKIHKKVHGVLPYACKTCSRRFYYSATLARHARSHSGEKPYSCDKCAKQFKQLSGLKEHIRTHTGFKPHACAWCGMRFYQAATLKRHHRTHTGEKPYACDRCGKQFNQNSHMKKHISSVHEGEKPYSCNLCGKQFCRQTTLVVHMRSHTGEKPYTCDKCYTRFSSRSCLVRHLKTHNDG